MRIWIWRIVLRGSSIMILWVGIRDLKILMLGLIRGGGDLLVLLKMREVCGERATHFA